MRFRARYPLRARGCAIAITEQGPSREFFLWKSPVRPVKNLQRSVRRGGEGEGGELVRKEREEYPSSIGFLAVEERDG